MDDIHTWWPLLVALTLNAGASVLMKVGAETSRPPGAAAGVRARLFGFFNGPTLCGIGLFAVNLLVYRMALDRLPISVAYPIMVSMGLVLVSLAAAMLPMLKEKIRPLHVLGMVLIGVGVWLVANG